MAQTTVGIQPSVLRWARESHGYSINDVALKLKRDPSDVLAWETGQSAPTYVQLEELAYRIYHRPLAVFFFPEPPREPQPQQAFRSLSNADLQNLEPNTRYQIRLAMAFQSSLKELFGKRNPQANPIFQEVRLSLNESIQKQAAHIRTILQVNIEIQSSWHDDDSALKAWRFAIENAGVFVFKNSFKQKNISGFCLLDAEFPIIYLNNSHTKTRQIFSLLHELAHILLQTNSVSKNEPLETLTGEHGRIERFCNAFAAELLMPSDDFSVQIRNQDLFDDQSIQCIARHYGVSREAVLRRLLDLQKVSQEYYQQKSALWKSQQKTQLGGGDYYATQASYLGERYLNLVLGKYQDGSITLAQAASYLGVSAKNMAGLEEIIARKGIPA